MSSALGSLSRSHITNFHIGRCWSRCGYPEPALPNELEEQVVSHPAQCSVSTPGNATIGTWLPSNRERWFEYLWTQSSWLSRKCWVTMRGSPMSCMTALNLPIWIRLSVPTEWVFSCLLSSWKRFSFPYDWCHQQSLHESHFVTSPDDESRLTNLGTFALSLGIDLTLGSLIGLGIQFGIGREAIQMASIFSFPKVSSLLHLSQKMSIPPSDSSVQKRHLGKYPILCFKVQMNLTLWWPGHLRQDVTSTRISTLNPCQLWIFCGSLTRSGQIRRKNGAGKMEFRFHEFQGCRLRSQMYFSE